jgi:hypothetical protein
MPYDKIHNKDGTYTVKNAETGKVHASHTTLAKAEAQMRLLHGVDHGMKPRGNKSSGKSSSGRGRR